MRAQLCALWWLIPVTLALERWRQNGQKDEGFKASIKTEQKNMHNSGASCLGSLPSSALLALWLWASSFSPVPPLWPHPRTGKQRKDCCLDKDNALAGAQMSVICQYFLPSFFFF